MKKQCQFIILPTDKASRIQNVNNEVFLADTNIESCGVQKAQHIYIISDDEIKQGDWFYCSKSNEYIKCYEKTSCESDKKIIATSNPELHKKWTPIPVNINDERGYIMDVPCISPSSLEHIIPKYTKGENTVMVEYEDCMGVEITTNKEEDRINFKYSEGLRPKLQDGCIVISRD